MRNPVIDLFPPKGMTVMSSRGIVTGVIDPSVFRRRYSLPRLPGSE